MAVVRIIDLSKKESNSVICEFIKPSVIRVITKRGHATMRLSPGTWKIRDATRPMTLKQKILKFLGFYEEKHYISAVRIG